LSRCGPTPQHKGKGPRKKRCRHLSSHKGSKGQNKTDGLLKTSKNSQSTRRGPHFVGAGRWEHLTPDPGQGQTVGRGAGSQKGGPVTFRGSGNKKVVRRNHTGAGPPRDRPSPLSAKGGDFEPSKKIRFPKETWGSGPKKKWWRERKVALEGRPSGKLRARGWPQKPTGKTVSWAQKPLSRGKGRSRGGLLRGMKTGGELKTPGRGSSRRPRRRSGRVG